MKRFDGIKGVFDVVEIWEYVVLEILDVKLILIGYGIKINVNKLERMIKDKKFEENVKILGLIYDFEEKFKILVKSKVFFLFSYEENWVIVIGEVMVVGLFVVCYDLFEIWLIWKDNVIWILRGNKKEFVKKVVELFENENVGKRVGENGVRFVKRYDWRKIVGKELMII